MFAVKSSTLCVLLCISFVAANASTIVDKNIKYDEKTQQLDSVHIGNSSVTTVIRDLEPKSASPRSVYITHAILDGTNETRDCQYELEDNIALMSAYPVGPHRVVLLSTYTEGSDREKVLEIEVINTAECTRMTKESLEFNSFNDAQNNLLRNSGAVLINDDETFDILYSDAKGCGDKLCKLGINFESKIVREATPSFAPLAGSYRFVKKSPSSSTFIVAELKPDEAYRISLVKPDGHVVLKESNSYDDVKDLDASNTHGVIRICSKMNTNKIDCEVFDDNGKSTSKVSVNVPHKVETVTIQNLVDGKFVLLSEEEKTGAALMKVKGDGSVIGVAKLPNFPSGSSDVESYLDVIDNQACVTRQFSGHGNVKITRECYNDSDFH